MSSAAASPSARSGWMTFGLGFGSGGCSRLPRAPLGLAHRPAAVARVACQPPPGVVVLAEQDRPAVPLGQVAGLDQLERLLGQVEQADQVGDRDAAAADPAADLLLGEAEVVDEHRARARLLDRVEVLAGHVLGEGEVEPLRSRRLGARSRGSGSIPAIRAARSRRSPAISSKRAARERPHDDRLEHAPHPIDSASATSAVSSKLLRGWRGFGLDQVDRDLAAARPRLAGGALSARIGRPAGIGHLPAPACRPHARLLNHEQPPPSPT